MNGVALDVTVHMDVTSAAGELPSLASEKRLGVCHRARNKTISPAFLGVRMVPAKKFLALLVSCAMLCSAQGNIFTKVRYNGGSVATKVDPKDWGNRLTVTSDVITLELKGKAKTKLEIPSKSVTSLSYGQEAQRSSWYST